MSLANSFVRHRDNIQGRAIGGYQGLELPLYEKSLNQSTIKINSARSGIKLVLSSLDIKKIWLPAYTCDAVVLAALDLGVSIKFYSIDSNFAVDAALQLKAGEHILITDYYGLCGYTVKQNVHRFGYANTIVDCSQAYFSEQTRAVATIFSPRKFFGLPDGGLLYSKDSRIHQPEQRDNSSESRMPHLISRLTNSPEVAYQQYLEAEQAISDLPVQGMSCLTERLLQAIDYEEVRTARTRNARYLHERLGKYNQLSLAFDDNPAPLCYPFLPSVKTSSRSELISRRVYVPSYWPEVLNRVNKGSFEWKLVTNGLFLPCDQRYNEGDMGRLISLLAIK
ncbi:hypothetical protein [Billgrantia bachuensis]|uniref:DegT/DnrJ/EryC1/StrS aminotransferase family protein n=1 Tax=Billgrantia bachuensis TaxID=2717286 RepID=A0ABX0PRW4_9GAMM|nr:hypothetical protein [Halomonas bachuensis]NIC04299.1 hypothetical protein [Halomonas bachuensis]